MNAREGRMTVGVVIPCRNEAGYIAHVLDALLAQALQPDEVVVVDDGSTDGTRAAVDEWSRRHAIPPVRVLAGPCEGIPAAVNAGVTGLETDIIVRLDGHCRPHQDYVRRSVQCLMEPGAGVAGGVWEITRGAETTQAWAIAVALAHPLGSGGARYRAATGGERLDVDTVPFGAFRRSLWVQLGGLDETLKSNEDYDFNCRVRRQGLRVVLDPAIRCLYYARPTLVALCRQYWRYGYWKARMLRHNLDTARLRQVIPALLVPALLAGVVGALVFSSPLWALGVAAYPLTLVTASAYVALRRHQPAAVLRLMGAFGTLQIAWSLGFWSAALGRSVASAPAGSARQRRVVSVDGSRGV
jgi:glycosyltransferase involved in cell wall biosynthesis